MMKVMIPSATFTKYLLNISATSSLFEVILSLLFKITLF